MESMSTGKKVLIFVTLVIYVIHLVLNGLSARGGPDNKLFPNSVSNVSKAFHLEITPVGATFAIWGAIFTYQLGWLIYATTTVCRSSLPSANILSSSFFISFNVNIVLISVWLFVWARELAVGSLVVILLAQVFADISIWIASRDLKAFLDDQKMLNKSKADIWCIRLLVQNGILFYSQWTLVATLINVAVVLAYVGTLSTFTASLISLVTLGILVIAWFVLENFFLEDYFEYTFTEYITLIIANTGIFVANNKDDGNEVIRGISLGFIILSALLLMVRIIIIAVRATKITKIPLNTQSAIKYHQFKM